MKIVDEKGQQMIGMVKSILNLIKIKYLTQHEFGKRANQRTIKAGKTVEKIAKILDKGKTEIEL